MNPFYERIDPALERMALHALPGPLGMKPLAYAVLNDEQQRMWEKLDAYQAPFLEEKLLIEGDFRTPEHYQEAFTEWKRFLGLAKTSGRFLGMPSEKVDAVWHQFILFTPDYMKFCDEHYGRYFHHVPNIPSRKQGPDGVEALVQEYVPRFGPLPPIWEVCSHRQDAVMARSLTDRVV